MATLKKNGTELARFEYATNTTVVMSNGRVLRNYGQGWKRWRHAKPGVRAVDIADSRGASYNTRRAACPHWAAFIAGLCRATSLKRRGELAMAICLMPGDADGVHTTMEDHGVSLDLEEVCALCDLYVRGREELQAYRVREERKAVITADED